MSMNINHLIDMYRPIEEKKIEENKEAEAVLVIKDLSTRQPYTLICSFTLKGKPFFSNLKEENNEYIISFFRSRNYENIDLNPYITFRFQKDDDNTFYKLLFAVDLFSHKLYHTVYHYNIYEKYMFSKNKGYIHSNEYFLNNIKYFVICEEICHENDNFNSLRVFTIYIMMEYIPDDHHTCYKEVYRNKISFTLNNIKTSKENLNNIIDKYMAYHLNAFFNDISLDDKINNTSLRPIVFL